MQNYSRIFHFNPNNPGDAVLLGVLDDIVTRQGGKVHALRWMLRNSITPPAVRLEDESIARIVDEIERRGMQASIRPQREREEREGAVVISPSLAGKWE